MSKNKMTKILIIIAVGITLFTLGGCSKEQTTLEKIKESGKIVLGTSADYPPYEFHKEINGKDEIVGFDIEIAKEVAKDLGVELEIKDMAFEGLLAALDAGNVDFVIAGMNVTPDRMESVDFSKSYFQAEQSLLVKSNNKDKYKTFNDLTGMKVGIQKATTQEDYANTIKDVEIKALSKITDLVLELKNDKVQGVILVTPVAQAYAKANDDLAIADVVLEKEEPVAIAVKKNNAELVLAINKTIDKLTANDTINKFINDATNLAEDN